MKTFDVDFDRTALPKSKFAVVRVDGKNFGSFTKKMGFKFPEDAHFMNMMDESAKTIMGVFAAPLAYVTSDEASIIIRADRIGNFPFGGKVSKITSIAASTATAGMVMSVGNFEFSALPIFDGRVGVLSSFDDVRRYIRARRELSFKNAVSNLCTVHFSARTVHGKSVEKRLNMLEKAGVAWDERSPWANGRIFERTAYLGHGYDRQKKVEVEVVRHRVCKKDVFEWLEQDVSQ